MMRDTLKKYKWLAVAAHLAAPLALVLFVSGPLYFNDNAVMIYFMHRAVEWYREFGALWGYDPTFAAGYPLNFTWNSHFSIQFLATLLYPIPEYIVLLAATVAGVIMAPFCFMAGLRNFGLKGANFNTALVLMLVYWWCGFPAVMLLLGMPSSIFVLHLSFYTISLYYRFFRENNPAIITRLYVMTPLCFMAHKSAVIMLALPAAILFLIHIRKLGLKRLAHLAAISALVLCVNSIWLVPFTELFRYKMTVPGAPHGLSLDPLRIFKDYFTLSKIMGPRPEEPGGGNVLMLLLNTVVRDSLLVFGVYGIVQWWRAGRKALAGFFAAHTALFMLEVYFGSFWSATALLYPTRYIPNLDLMLAPPAAAGLHALYNRMVKRAGDRKKVIRMLKPAIAIIVVFSFLPFAFFHRELNTRPDEDTLTLVRFLGEYTSPAGRVLLEDSGWNDRDAISDRVPPKYGGSQFSSLMPDLTGREFIGGPYPYVFLAHHYVSFRDGTFLNRPLADFSTGEIEKELDRYYARWIVCWSADCKSFFIGDKNLYAHRKDIGKFSLFERNKFDTDPFLVGAGYIVADQRGLRCYGVEPKDGKAVLKYHWLEHLEAPGTRGIEKEESGGDPVGFIQIDNPPDYFRIYNGYVK